MEYFDLIRDHYETVWSNRANILRWKEGPADQLPDTFRVLEFSPNSSRQMWTYCTCCMSQPKDTRPVELHLFSKLRCELHVELLTAIAHYHSTGNEVGLGDTVNFGRPWLPHSECQYGLISLPYLDGPKLEKLEIEKLNMMVRFLWLVPITKGEVEFKKLRGTETLEQKLEDAGIDYLDPKRKSVV